MALFKKKDDSSKPKATKPAKQPKADKKADKKEKKGGGLASAIGLKAKVEPKKTDDEVLRERHKKICVEVWGYLRNQVDKSVGAYFIAPEGGSRDREFRNLSRFLEGPALERMKLHLSALDEAGLFPNAGERASTRPQIRVVGEPELDSNGRPSSFTIEERWYDITAYQRLLEGGHVNEAQCQGDERIMRATVKVYGKEYRISELIAVSPAVLAAGGRRA